MSQHSRLRRLTGDPEQSWLSLYSEGMPFRDVLIDKTILAEYLTQDTIRLD